MSIAKGRTKHLEIITRLQLNHSCQNGRLYAQDQEREHSTRPSIMHILSVHQDCHDVCLTAKIIKMEQRLLKFQLKISMILSGTHRIYI